MSYSDKAVDQLTISNNENEIDQRLQNTIYEINDYNEEIEEAGADCSALTSAYVHAQDSPKLALESISYLASYFIKRHGLTVKNVGLESDIKMLGMEGFKETLSKIWEAIKAGFRWLVEKIKNLLGFSSTKADHLNKKIKDKEKELEEIETELKELEKEGPIERQKEIKEKETEIKVMEKELEEVKRNTPNHEIKEEKLKEKIEEVKKEIVIIKEKEKINADKIVEDLIAFAKNHNYNVELNSSTPHAKILEEKNLFTMFDKILNHHKNIISKLNRSIYNGNLFCFEFEKSLTTQIQNNNKLLKEMLSVFKDSTKIIYQGVNIVEDTIDKCQANQYNEKGISKYDYPEELRGEISKYYDNADSLCKNLYSCIKSNKLLSKKPSVYNGDFTTVTHDYELKLFEIGWFNDSEKDNPTNIEEIDVDYLDVSLKFLFNIDTKCYFNSLLITIEKTIEKDLIPLLDSDKIHNRDRDIIKQKLNLSDKAPDHPSFVASDMYIVRDTIGCVLSFLRKLIVIMTRLTEIDICNRDVIYSLQYVLGDIGRFKIALLK